jgi:hypothetical protein
MTRKPQKLKVTGGKWPTKEEVLCQYKMEPCKQLTADQKGSIRLQSLYIAMSKLPLELWDSWISHTAEYDFYPAAWIPDEIDQICLFCHVTETNCSLCTGIPNYPVACGRHEDVIPDELLTCYSPMIEAGIEKVQGFADWLEERKKR